MDNKKNCQSLDVLGIFNCNNPEQITTWANAISLLLSKGRTVDELNVLGNFIVAVGGLMLTLAALKQTCDSKEEKIKQIADLKKQIKQLEDSL